MSKSETRKAKLKTLWGEIEHVKTRYRCSKCQSSQTVWHDSSLDNSDCTPLVLARLEEFAVEVPYRKACQFMQTWGVQISKSKVALLSQTLEKNLQKLGEPRLEALASQTLIRKNKSAVTQAQRQVTWMLEMDGTLVPTRVTDEKGFVSVEYREVKNAVLYEKNTPSKRYQLSGIYTVEVFTILVLGLLRFARVSQADRLVGLSDGAVWIANIFCAADVNYHILDVFHASSYFETLMLGLGWTEAQRMKERAALLRGEIDVFAWMNWNVTSTQRAGLKDEALKAFSYLEKQSNLLHTTYPRFKTLGLEVIGSGEIEGANKSVIGARLKVSGAQWIESGASAKSFVRGMNSSSRKLVSFDEARFKAFPRAA